MKWIDLNRAKIKVYGKKSKLALKGISEEHKAFLHNLLTNDIVNLPEKHFNYNLRLNGKGYPIQDFFVYNYGDFFLLDTEEDSKKIIDEFDKLKLSMQVFFEDLTPNYKHIFIFGENADEFIKKAFNIEQLEPFKFVFQENVTVARNFLRNGEDGYDIFGEIDDVLNFLENKNKITQEEFESIRIENCIPKIHKELKEGYLPLETPITEFAISFTKGCYIGQEVIARVYYRGNPPRTLAKFSFNENLHEGEKIVDNDKKIGEITSISPKKNIALGYILKAKLRENTFKTESGKDVKLLGECKINAVNSK